MRLPSKYLAVVERISSSTGHSIPSCSCPEELCSVRSFGIATENLNVLRLYESLSFLRTCRRRCRSTRKDVVVSLKADIELQLHAGLREDHDVQEEASQLGCHFRLYRRSDASKVVHKIAYLGITECYKYCPRFFPQRQFHIAPDWSALGKRFNDFVADLTQERSNMSMFNSEFNDTVHRLPLSGRCWRSE